MRDADVARLIRQHEIDVVLDMHGLSSGARPEIFASRPAPLQMTWLGYIGTTTFPWIDYVVADEHSLPTTLAPFYSEKVIRLPGSFLPPSSALNPFLASTDVRVGSPVVLSCFNNIYKIKPPMLDAWADILNQTRGQTQLWLLDDNPAATENVRAYMEARLADKSQLVFWPRAAYADYSRRLAETDIYLDTYPYNAGSTARDVLRAGLPMVSMVGNTFVSRMGLSVLAEAGMPGLAVNTYKDYTDRVVALVNSPQTLIDLKRHFRSVLQDYPLGNYVRAFEEKILALTKP
jgi:predicted O-linked N-acetylglucosamine transferase (SPINDLY family)